MNKIIEILKKNFLTKNMSLSDLKIIAETMYPKTFEKGDNIITYGDMGQEYFILEQGEVEILVYKEGTDPKDPNLD